MRTEHVCALIMFATACAAEPEPAGQGFTHDEVAVATLAVTGPGTYTFSVAQSGSYTLTGNVIAPDDSSNSFFIDIDSDPAGSTARIWDILPYTSTYAPRAVSWRGSGTYDADQYNPKSWTLTAGSHTLYIRARETGTQINQMTVNGSATATPPPPTTTASCPVGSGATYYVATTGSDSNPGTSSAPFRTITHAYSYAAPGVNIVVAPGTYTDYQTGWGLHLGNSGTSSSPIFLRSATRGAAIIDGGNASDRNEAIYIDGSYNVVCGFGITRGPRGGISIWSNGNQLLFNEIHHNGNVASTSTNGQDGVYSSETTAGNRYVGNYIHDNGRTGSNLDHGLYLCGDNEDVFDNISIRNASNGLQIAGYTTVSTMRVMNNVFAANGTNGIILWMALSGVTIENNIFYDNGHAGIGSYDAHGSGVVIDHNLSYGNAYGDYSLRSGGSDFSYTLGSTVTSNPLFVSDSSDFHLQTGSPAIDAGLTLSAVTFDLDGTARPQGGAYDIGAYER